MTRFDRGARHRVETRVPPTFTFGAAPQRRSTGSRHAASQWADGAKRTCSSPRTAFTVGASTRSDTLVREVTTAHRARAHSRGHRFWSTSVYVLACSRLRWSTRCACTHRQDINRGGPPATPLTPSDNGVCDPAKTHSRARTSSRVNIALARARCSQEPGLEDGGSAPPGGWRREFNPIGVGC